MRRVVIHRPGNYDRLCVEECPDPVPGAGEVLIDVDAVGINFADCVTRMGLYASAKQFVGYPITPGFEVAGTVVGVGEQAAGLETGTGVVALTLFGGYATRIAVSRDQVFPIPSGWTMPDAAGFPTVFLTAWFALFELAHPRPEAKVLIHSAAGGVGQALVQLAKMAGCEVTGVVGGSHKVDVVRALGASRVIDKSRENPWARAVRFAPDGFDAIFDANGAETLRQSYRHLVPGGKLVVYGFHSMFTKGRGRPNWLKLIRDYFRTPRFNPLYMTSENKSVLGFNLSFMTQRSDFLRKAMNELLGWVDAGRIRPLPSTTYPFDQVARAHADLESGQTVGKLVLVTR